MSQESILFTVSPTELVELIRISIKQEIHSLITGKDRSNLKYSLQLYSRSETAKILHISLPTLDDYTKRKLIKSCHIGKRVLYKHIDIEQALRCITV